MSEIQFSDNYNDLSTDTGFQFEFYCEHCHEAWRSPFDRYAAGTAEGLQLIAFRDPPLGLAMKIHDGSDRALPAICLAVLAQLGLTGASVPVALKAHARPAIRNHRQLTTGEIVATLKLGIVR